MITLSDFWMGRDATYANELTDEIMANAYETVESVNKLLSEYERETGKVVNKVTSGWRPPAVNRRVKGAATGSNHQKALAVDLSDPNGDLDKWCLKNLSVLHDCGLWLEHPGWTDGWCHLQIVAPRSGARVFVPSTSDPMTTIYGRSPVYYKPA